jgi:hypothetical protein
MAWFLFKKVTAQMGEATTCIAAASIRLQVKLQLNMPESWNRDRQTLPTLCSWETCPPVAGDVHCLPPRRGSEMPALPLHKAAAMLQPQGREPLAKLAC